MIGGGLALEEQGHGVSRIMHALSKVFSARVAGGSLAILLLACGGETSDEQGQTQPTGAGGSVNQAGGSAGSASGAGGSTTAGAGGAASGAGGASAGGASSGAGGASSGAGGASAGGTSSGPGGASAGGSSGGGGAPAGGSSGVGGASAGGSSGAGGASAGAAGAAVWGDSSCAVCLADSCGEAFGACQQQPDCAAYVACVRVCPLEPGLNVPQTACANACSQPSSPGGQSAIGQLGACFQESQKSPDTPCTKACSPTGLLFGESACWGCISDQCSSLLAACESIADCQASVQCVLACGQDAQNPGSPTKECREGCPVPASVQGSAALAGLSQCGEEVEKPGAACAVGCSAKP